MSKLRQLAARLAVARGKAAARRKAERLVDGFNHVTKSVTDRVEAELDAARKSLAAKERLEAAEREGTG